MFPKETYFDLTNQLQKLELLNPKRALNLVRQWKEGLERIQAYLKDDIERNIEQQLKNSIEIFSLFKIETTQPCKVKLHSKNSNLQVSFNLRDPASSSMDKVQSLVRFVHDIYDIEEVCVKVASVSYRARVTLK